MKKKIGTIVLLSSILIGSLAVFGATDAQAMSYPSLRFSIPTPNNYNHYYNQPSIGSSKTKKNSESDESDSESDSTTTMKSGTSTPEDDKKIKEAIVDLQKTMQKIKQDDKQLDKERKERRKYMQQAVEEGKRRDHIFRITILSIACAPFLIPIIFLAIKPKH